MTLRDFLTKNAPADQVRRRKARQEWIAAVDRLLKQVPRDWVADADASGVLELEPLQVEKQEQGLGAYRIAGLGINFGERSVKVVPVGRTVLAHLGPHAESGHQNAEGRVDITNGFPKYSLYRKLTDTAEQWLAQRRRFRSAAIGPRAVRGHPAGTARVIASLDDAWGWYQAVRLARTMVRLGDRHWNNLPWDGELGRDSHLQQLDLRRNPR